VDGGISRGVTVTDKCNLTCVACAPAAGERTKKSTRSDNHEVSLRVQINI
jgi:molybdenum cofactor biosynthesis enzyme MoaA